MMRRQGSVLVALLWCMVFLSLLVFGSLYTSRAALSASKNSQDRIQAHFLALAGVEKAKALIFHDARARKAAARHHSGDLYNAPNEFREVPLGRGTFSVIRRGSDEEGSALVYGISDEESRLNINSCELQDLTRVPQMPAETAASIVDWRDNDGQAQPGGAEQEYYASLKPPYLPRNDRIQTAREMLLIRGVSEAALLGEDANANGLLDDEEDDGAESHPNDNGDGKLNVGWASIFAYESEVPNTAADGSARINVQTASENDLSGVAGMTPQIAKAIVEWREQNKIENLAQLLEVKALAPRPPGSGVLTPGGRPGAPGQLQRAPNAPPAEGPPGSPTPATPGGSPAGQQGQAPRQPTGPELINEDLFLDIADYLAVDDETRTVGPININTASALVLRTLPGVSDELAQAIIMHRNSAGYFANAAHVLRVSGMTRDIYKQIAPRITARSETFRILSEGQVQSSGARSRIEVVIRLGSSYVDTLHYRENL